MDTNTGYGNVGRENAGSWNAGSGNAGSWNAGSGNVGNGNVGRGNAGSGNVGNGNVGRGNAGNGNAGSWNAGNGNAGLFNTTTPDNVRVFNKHVDAKELEAWARPDWLFFQLTEWISEVDMTQKEKEDHAGYKTTGGYLKRYDYKEAFQASYSAASREDQLRIKECPGFDAEVFFEISGIRVDEDFVEEMTLADVCKELGRDIKIVKT